MISYQLKCSTGHEFEAWFRSSESYDEQRVSGDVSCPLCGDPEVMKAIMAPALATGRNSDVPVTHEERASEVAREVLEAVGKLREHVEENCDYVGEDFADEARRIHNGEAEERGIYGEANSEESESLDEDGIEYFRLPTPPRRND